MSFLEIIIQVEEPEVWRDIIIADLDGMGFDGFEELENGVKAFTVPEKFNEAELLAHLNALSCNFKLSKNVLEERNWNEVWESNFNPIDVNGKCYIRAPFHEKNENSKYEIVIEPKMSFGTGHHSTTKLMIEKLLDLDLKNKTVLDMGCGTGVLGILALKLGAKRVVAIDIDEWAYSNAIENFEMNNCADFEVFKGGSELLQNQTFDVILANINRNVLVSDIPAYTKVLKSNGILLLSGFIDKDMDLMKETVTSNSLSWINNKSDKEWVMAYVINE